MIVLGIDLGNKGGLALNNTITGEWKLNEMPVRTTIKNRKELDLDALIVLIDRLVEENDQIDLAVVEAIPSIPGNGSFSMRSLAKNWGMVVAVLRCAKIKTIEPDPRVWKKELFPEKSVRDKEAAIDYVLTKVSSIDLPKLGPRSKKYHDGLADAVCIATYGKQVTK